MRSRICYWNPVNALSASAEVGLKRHGNERWPGRRGLRKWFGVGLWPLLALGFLAPAAEPPPEDRTLLSVERIFSKEDFKLQDWGPARWLADGSGYTTLEASESIPDFKDVVRWDPLSGRRDILVAASNLVAHGASKPLKIEDYGWSDDFRKLLVFTNTRRVWRRETRGDYWVFDRDSAQLKKLGGAAPEASLMFATFSPDGERVAYVSRNDLYVQSVGSLAITRLTSGGSPTLIHGTSDWVNEEEFGLRHGFRWSPDGRHIAFWQFDTTGVREFQLINNTEGLYPGITSFAYPKVGETNSACRLGVVRSTGGRTKWIRTENDPRNHYIPEMEWAPDSRHVVFQHLNRLQNTNRVRVGDIRTGATRDVFVDRDDAWVDVMDDWQWIEQGQRFLWLSERDGWQHLYSVHGTSGEVTLLTPGDFDVIRLAGVDEKLGFVYFIASPDNPTQRYLYRAPLGGAGQVERVTPANQPGSHAYDVAKDGRWAFHTVSGFGRPPSIELVRLPDHAVIRSLADNASVSGKLAELKTGPSEFFRIDLGEAGTLDAWCMLPPDFDPNRKYPLLLYVYGEPAGSTVVDQWGGETHLWHRLLAQRGYVVMSIDNRGTAAPRGRAWRKSIYRQIGILASEDQAEALRRVLAERPYLDPERVGIWGWSGGGSMSLNAIFRYPDLYRMAMAVAFVSNQRFYDTIYQERYMGLPGDNADGFRDGSPITFAHQLKGSLLLVYGTGDDNCHYQNCEVLINELIKHGKPFSLMSYPNRTHAIREGDGTRRHLYDTLTRYLETNLPAGR